MSAKEDDDEDESLSSPPDRLRSSFSCCLHWLTKGCQLMPLPKREGISPSLWRNWVLDWEQKGVHLSLCKNLGLEL